MKTTRARQLTNDLKADGMIRKGGYFHALANIAGLIFANPAITDDEIGTALANWPGGFDVAGTETAF